MAYAIGALASSVVWVILVGFVFYSPSQKKHRSILSDEAKKWPKR